MAEIFITYAAQDAERVRHLAEALRVQGYEVDFDRTPLPGQNVVTEMRRRLNEAKAVLAVWTLISVEEALVRDEAGAALEQNKLVPVRIDSVESPMGFRALAVADLSTWPSPQAQGELLAVVKALAHLTGRPAPASLKHVGGLGLTSGGMGAAPARVEDSGPTDGRKFLRTRGFWAWTSALAAGAGMLWFLSPESRENMGADPAERIGYLIGITLAALLFLWAAQALLHVSRLWVGKTTSGFWSRGFLICLGVSLVFGIAIAFTPPEEGQTQMSLTEALGGSLAIFPFFCALPVAVVRGVRRLIGGKPGS